MVWFLLVQLVHSSGAKCLHSVETAACGSHLRESPIGVIRDSSEVLLPVREKPSLHLELYQMMLQTKCSQPSVAR